MLRTDPAQPALAFMLPITAFFNLACTGYALAAVASTLLNGKTIEPGFELKELGKAEVDSDKHIIRFHKVLLVNKDNIDSLY